MGGGRWSVAPGPPKARAEGLQSDSGPLPFTEARTGMWPNGSLVMSSYQ